MTRILLLSTVFANFGVMLCEIQGLKSCNVSYSLPCKFCTVFKKQETKKPVAKKKQKKKQMHLIFGFYCNKVDLYKE